MCCTTFPLRGATLLLRASATECGNKVSVRTIRNRAQGIRKKYLIDLRPCWWFSKVCRQPFACTVMLTLGVEQRRG